MFGLSNKPILSTAIFKQKRIIAMPKGMLAFVYRPADGSDCSLKGISSKHNSIIITGPGIPEVFEPSENCPEMVLEPNANRVAGNMAIYPADKGEKWYCFGGNFAYSSDSRFPSNQPIKIYDRRE